MSSVTIPKVLANPKSFIQLNQIFKLHLGRKENMVKSPGPKTHISLMRQYYLINSIVYSEFLEKMGFFGVFPVIRALLDGELHFPKSHFFILIFIILSYNPKYIVNI